MSVSAHDRSYRALLGVPSVGRMLLGMQIARIGQSMVSVAIVLFAFASYRSAALAGMATFSRSFRDYSSARLPVLYWIGTAEPGSSFLITSSLWFP